MGLKGEQLFRDVAKTNQRYFNYTTDKDNGGEYVFRIKSGPNVLSPELYVTVQPNTKIQKPSPAATTTQEPTTATPQPVQQSTPTPVVATTPALECIENFSLDTVSFQRVECRWNYNWAFFGSSQLSRVVVDLIGSENGSSANEKVTQSVQK